MPFVIIARVVDAGAVQTRTSEIPGPTLRIGRGTDTDLHLDDPSVQFNHAVIQESAGTYTIRDLGAVSLTTVNGAAVKEAVLSGEGTIRIGPYELRFSRRVPQSPLTLEYELPTITAAETASGQPEAPGPGAAGKVEARAGAGQAAAGASASARRPPEEKLNLVGAYQLRTRYLSKTSITIAAVLLVLGIAVVAYALRKHRVFMPGTISMKHRLFADECIRCHTPWKPVLTVVADRMCLTCHSGPPHFKDKFPGPAPQCASCHVEHKGKAILAATFDSSCTQCHADLKVKDGDTPYARTIHSFTSDHPEFAVTVQEPNQKTPLRVRLNEPERLKDTASIKLNHKLHLKDDLMGPDGPEQLTCASCHKPDARGAYMRPINYRSDCMRCHLLDFDERFPGKTVPHGEQLSEIERFLRASYAEFYLLEHQAELRGRGMAKRLPGAPKTKEEMWVGEMVEKAERFLIGKPGAKTKTGKCVLCHTFERAGEASGRSSVLLPKVVKTAMPQRWLPNSVFNHLAHNTVKCVACHEAAPKSEASTDVLLPRVSSCRTCHFEPGGARADCVDCHVYHDKTQMRKPGQEPSSIEQYMRRPEL